MDGDETAWVPPRPDRADRMPERPPASTMGFAVPQETSGRSRSLPKRRRLSPAGRVAFGYLALVVVIALVAGLGALVQPVYGSLAPYGGTTFSDVRSRPTASGWSVDLAKIFSANAPGRCLAFHSDSAGPQRELVTATLPTPDASPEDAACEVASPDTPGIVAMLDPDTGAVLWRRDLSQDLDMTVVSLLWHATRAAGTVVVGVDGSRGDRLVSLDIDTGRTVSTTRIDDSDEVINFAVSGSLVLSVVPNSGGTLETYYLRRVDDLSKVVWTTSLSSTIFLEMLPDRIVIPMPTETVVVDGRTGAQTRWGANLWRNQGILVTGDHILAVSVTLGVGVAAGLALYDDTGRRLWSVPAAGISALTVSRSCVLVSNSSELTCRDKKTGAVRWTSPLNGEATGTPDGSTTANVVGTAAVTAGSTALEITEYDGSTGRPRFTTSIPRGARIAGQGTTTGYALDTSSPSAASTLMAFDLDSGRTLWSLTGPDLEVWSGHLVQITPTGLAQELTDARSARSHAMLDG